MSRICVERLFKNIKSCEINILSAATKTSISDEKKKASSTKSDKSKSSTMDCYNGFEPLFDPQKKAMPITPAFCFAQSNPFASPEGTRRNSASNS